MIARLQAAITTLRAVQARQDDEWHRMLKEIKHAIEELEQERPLFAAGYLRKAADLEYELTGGCDVTGPVLDEVQS